MTYTEVAQMGKREFWGLDFETSGTTHTRHVPIQLGITSPNLITRSWLIGGWDWWNECTASYHHDCCVPEGTKADWDARAFDVHGITQERLKADGLPLREVTQQALDFIMLTSRAWHGERKLVGWNVASFDVPFLRKYLPDVARILSYQSADLNAICFAISQAHGISYKGVKRDAQQWSDGMAQMNWEGADGRLHDAGYDSLLAVHAFNYLTGRIKDGF